MSNTLTFVHDLVNHLGGAADLLGATLSENSGKNLASKLKDWFAPLLLLAISFGVVVFIWQRQLNRLAMFCGIAMIVCGIFFFPDLLKDGAETVKNMF
jgi:hypothetical protein